MYFKFSDTYANPTLAGQTFEVLYGDWDKIAGWGPWANCETMLICTPYGLIPVMHPDTAGEFIEE